MRQTKLAKAMNHKKTIRLLMYNNFDAGTTEFTFDYEHYNQFILWIEECKRNLIHFKVLTESRRGILEEN